MLQLQKFYNSAKKFPSRAYHNDLEKVYKKFNGVILDSVIGEITDLQDYFTQLSDTISSDTKVLISYHNHWWEPILTLASRFGFRKKVGNQNWLTVKDVNNLLMLSGFEVVSTQKRFYGITVITVAKPVKVSKITDNYSVSIVVPARNESGNIPKIVPSIPKFGKFQEIIFVEGNSTDNTWGKIQKEIIKVRKNKLLKVKGLQQKGKGKADAVRMGFLESTGEILMIYDADMTVPAHDLRKFYECLNLGIGEFANGSRLVYPMERQAMQTLNKFGNHLFGILFSKILGQSFKDTLCGTKVLFKKDFNKYFKDYERFLRMDPFGDFALIFTAIKNNLKVVEIPVRYKERIYGSTNISRFRHGVMLLKMVFLAYKEFKT